MQRVGWVSEQNCGRTSPGGQGRGAEGWVGFGAKSSLAVRQLGYPPSFPQPQPHVPWAAWEAGEGTQCYSLVSMPLGFGAPEV